MPAVFDLLAAHEVSLCLHDKRDSAIDSPAIGPIIYMRCHGPNGDCSGRYAARTLSQWADRITAARKSRDVWVFFNNDPDAAAVADAAALRAALDDRLKSQATVIGRSP